MNLSSKSRKLHCILIIHVKGYLQTRTIAILLCAWQCNNIAPAIRRRTYCCRSVVSVGSRKSTQERAIRLLNVGEKDGKSQQREPRAQLRCIDRGDHDQRRRLGAEDMECHRGMGTVSYTSRSGTARRRLHCRGPSLPAGLRQRHCGIFDLISDCQVQALHADLSHRTVFW